MALAYNQAGEQVGQNQTISDYIVATANDTTSPVNGSLIDNRDGKLTYIGAQASCTAASGTSPTLTLTLQGSNNGTNWFTLLDETGSTIATSALSLSAGATTQINTSQKKLSNFPRFLRAIYTLGGTTPGFTGQVAVVLRRNFN